MFASPLTHPVIGICYELTDWEGERDNESLSVKEMGQKEGLDRRT